MSFYFYPNAVGHRHGQAARDARLRAEAGGGSERRLAHGVASLCQAGCCYRGARQPRGGRGELGALPAGAQRKRMRPRGECVGSLEQRRQGMVLFLTCAHDALTRTALCPVVVRNGVIFERLE